MKKILKLSLILLAGIILIVIVLVFLFLSNSKNSNMIYGVSFSPQYTHYLGLKTEDVYKTILDDWKFKYIRLSAQWDEIEKTKGSYDYKELDWLMDEASKRNVKVTLAVGRKTPRWPECHLPVWAKKMDYKDYKKDLLKYIELTINRYKNHKALEIWQVENEPFLGFGLCKAMPKEDLQAEIALVKKIDANHKVMVTDSGELSLWRKTAKVADLFGTTMYRVVWDKRLGYFSYDWLPSSFYRFKLWLNGRDIDKAFVSELQAEPWLPDMSMADTPLKEQFRSMDLNRFKKNVEFAAKTGMPRAYLWGAEWWYWLENKKDVKGYVEFMKGLRKE